MWGEAKVVTRFKLSGLAIGGALSAITLVFSAFAHADSQDDQFLRAVQAQGIGG
jgi:hypothetical protein